MNTRIAAVLSLLLCAPAALTAAPRVQSAVRALPAQNGKPAGFRGEFLSNLEDVEQKIVALAEATPPEKFAWRPAPGVRSISEVYMHVAGSNYVLASFVGTIPPRQAGDLEKTVTTKAEVVSELRRSFHHLRKAANAVSNMDKPVKMFGKVTSNRGVLVTVLSHVHEHLGQSIAYARMNGVIPPWSGAQ